jgi:membrane-associated phospholipid phosphatase
MRVLTTTAVAAWCLVHTAASAQQPDRHALIRRAQLWSATDVRSMDVRRGPAGPGAFEPGEMVACDYVPHELSGWSPKFACRIGKDDEVKVKYGGANGEVYGEVLATRLLWALGFGADAMYPVKVICRGCPESLGGSAQADGRRLFDPAVIERKMPGEEVTNGEQSGWAWPELDLVDAAAGGATKAEIDALKLLAVFLQHTDSKPEQQRLICRDPACSQPFMLIGDVGLTFGRANLTNLNAIGSVNLQEWGRTPVWKSTHGCVGNLPRSLTGTLKDPVISEDGRRLLAALLDQISDAQLRALFSVARVELRPAAPVVTQPGAPLSDADSPPAVEDWLREFRARQAAITERRCVDAWSSGIPFGFDTRPNRWLQSHASPVLTAIMNVISALGYTRVYLAIAVLLAFVVSFRAGAALLLLLALTSVLTDSAKTVATLPRPPAVDVQVQRLSIFHPAASRVEAITSRLPAPRQSVDMEDGYGFPSGHVAGAIAFFYGLITFFRWRRGWAALAIAAPLMSLSRMYLGQHFLADVLGGVAVAVIAAAIAMLALVLPRLTDSVRAGRAARRTFVVAAAFAVFSLLAGVPAPYDAGRLLGLALGVLLVVHDRFSSGRRYDDAPPRVRAARLAAAAVLFGIAWWTATPLMNALELNDIQAGALLAGLIPTTVLLAGPFFLERVLRARRGEARPSMGALPGR